MPTSGFAARDVSGARRIQEALRRRVREAPLPLGRIAAVGAADVTFLDEKEVVAAAVVLADFTTGAILEEAASVLRIPFPYVPGYLSFREGPAILAAWEKLSRRPDLLLLDGQGIAHPRRFGLASHVGVALDVPALGVAKSRLVGEYREPGRERGAWEGLYVDGERVGAVLRTRTGVRPVFVSVGHRIDLPSGIDVVLRLCSRFRLPDPARRAHRLTRELRAGRPPGGAGPPPHPA